MGRKKADVTLLAWARHLQAEIECIRAKRTELEETAHSLQTQLSERTVWQAELLSLLIKQRQLGRSAQSISTGAAQLQKNSSRDILIINTQNEGANKTQKRSPQRGFSLTTLVSGNKSPRKDRSRSPRPFERSRSVGTNINVTSESSTRKRRTHRKVDKRKQNTTEVNNSSTKQTHPTDTELPPLPPRSLSSHKIPCANSLMMFMWNLNVPCRDPRVPSMSTSKDQICWRTIKDCKLKMKWRGG